MNLKKKIFLMNLFTAIIPILTITIVSSFMFSNKIKELEQEKIKLINHIVDDRIDIQVNVGVETLNNLVKIYEEFKGDYPKDDIVQHIKHLTKADGVLTNIIFGSADKSFIIDSSSKKLNIPPDYDPTLSHWYLGALDSKEYYLSEEFNYLGMKHPVIALSKKIVLDGEVKGVLSGVLDISTLTNSIREYKIGDNGSFFILDYQNKVLVNISNNNNNVNNKYIDQKILPTMDNDVINFETPNGLVYCYIHYIERLGLFSIGTVLEKDLNSSIYELVRYTLIMVSIITGIIIALLSFITKNLEKSLNNLSYIINNISHGKCSKDIKKLTKIIDDKSELKFLRDSITFMNSEIMKRELQLKFVAETDQLTEIYNRRAILKFLKMEIERSKNFQTEYILIMFDLDRFKRLNDSYGHLFGDQVLKKICKVISGDIKKIDKFGRYGGEEFLILLPDTKLKEGSSIANRLRQKVESLKWKDDVVVTISMGVIGNVKNDTLDLALERVDKLLYKAKDNGRNKVESQIIDL